MLFAAQRRRRAETPRSARWRREQSGRTSNPVLAPAQTSAEDLPQPHDRPTPKAIWRSSTGDELPVGARLEATYKRKTYATTVERRGILFNKKLYQSPSAAGRAVKASAGVVGAAGQTDGRSFWSVRDPNTGRAVTVGELNPRKQIDAEKLLRELSELS